jgi:hypothetical protein
MHSKLSHRLDTNYILVTELCGFNKGISTESAAFRLTDSVLKFSNKKMLEEFSLFWQKLVIL